MPCTTSQSPDLHRFGPVIPVIILPAAAFLKSLKEQKSEALEQYKTGIQAKMLIDTGASSTVIDREIPKAFNLKHHGITTIATPSSSAHNCLTYDIDLVLPSNKLHIQNFQVIESNLKHQGIDGLLGRDILKNMLLLYHGYSNQYTLAI